MALPPAWVRGEIERPEGERNMGTWVAAVYTPEQQQRLGVDAFGHKKPTLAVDMDEVLVDFLGGLIKWHNATHGTSFVKSDFQSYYFHDTWGGTLAEGVEKVHAFFVNSFRVQATWVTPVGAAS